MFNKKHAERNLLTSEKDALEMIIDGRVTETELENIEDQFPGIKDTAYKKAMLEILNGVSAQRLSYFESLFPGIGKEAARINAMRKTSHGRQLWRTYTDTAHHGCFIRHETLYPQDDRMGFFELYFWSQVLDPNPMLMFITGDPLTALLIDEAFNLNSAQTVLDEVKNEPEWEDFQTAPDTVAIMNSDFQNNGFVPLPEDQIGRIPDDNLRDVQDEYPEHRQGQDQGQGDYYDQDRDQHQEHIDQDQIPDRYEQQQDSVREESYRDDNNFQPDDNSQQVDTYTPEPDYQAPDMGGGFDN